MSRNVWLNRLLHLWTLKPMQTYPLFKFKEFEIFLWKKRRFRLRWDSSPSFSIAGRLLGLESQRSQKRLFFHRKISNSLDLNLIYVPQARKLVFPLQLRVTECYVFRYRGIQCKNWTAHAHIVLQRNTIFFLFFFFSLLLRTALAPDWQSLVHLNCACVY